MESQKKHSDQSKNITLVSLTQEETNWFLKNILNAISNRCSYTIFTDYQ